MPSNAPDNLEDALDAALAKPDDAVPEPTSRRPWSFTSQVASLEPGDTACRLHQLDPDTTLSEMSESLTKLRAKCRNNVAPSVRQAASRTGGEYTIEVCDFVTPRGQFYVATIVTRTT